MATLIKVSQGGYGGTHGNLACAVLAYTGAVAINDVIDFGTLPPGIQVVRVTAGSDNAAATTVDVSLINEAGTPKVLAAGLDVNAKFTAATVAPANTGFENQTLAATVKGAAVVAGKTVYVYVEYVTLGTE
ncbi:MAG: hypothetical protein ACRCVX_02265 [Shewanella sp.]